jgi:hypothetical protein
VGKLTEEQLDPAIERLLNAQPVVKEYILRSIEQRENEALKTVNWFNAPRFQGAH